MPAAKPNALWRVVAEHFRAYPFVWIRWQELAQIGGGAGWRTRVSNCRTMARMDIENRTYTVTEGDQTWTVSEYRYLPASLLELAS